MHGIHIDEYVLKNINKSRIGTMTCGLLDALYTTDELMNCSRTGKKSKETKQRKTSIQDHVRYKAIKGNEFVGISYIQFVLKYMFYNCMFLIQIMY